MMDPRHQDNHGPVACDLDEPIAGNYFVATYPPFSTWTAAQVPDVVRIVNDASTAQSGAPLGLYVHIPFCMTRCTYCYYFSSAGASLERIDAYADAVCDELTAYGRSAVLAERNPSFVYFGGGTPSMLSERTLARLMERMQAVAPWTDADEVSFECAPKTATEDKLRTLREHGVTRLSLGVQALDDDVLQRNGRIHLVRDVHKGYAAVRSIGFPVVNIDLMVGLVGETDASFFDSLDRVIALEAESVTIYQLEIPHNTPLYRAMHSADQDIPVTSWETKRRRLGEAFARLEAAGYHVRSAYAAVRDPIRHRFVYQDAQYHGADVLGLGLSAFSYVNGAHFQNLTDDDAYARHVRDGEYPIGRAYLLSEEERLIREFVLQLKLGVIDGTYFREKFNVDVTRRFAQPLEELRRAGWLHPEGQRIILTRQGLLRADRLLPRFYRRCHQDIPYA